MNLDEQKQVNDILGTVRDAAFSPEQLLDLIENLICDFRSGASDEVSTLVQESNAATSKIRELIC